MERIGTYILRANRLIVYKRDNNNLLLLLLLLVLAVGAGRVDVEGRGVETADVGRAFARRVDHIQLGEQGNVAQVTGVVDRPAGRRRRLLMLQLLLASKLVAGSQFRQETGFVRMPLGSPQRIFAFAELLLLALEPRQAGNVTGRHPKQEKKTET